MHNYHLRCDADVIQALNSCVFSLCSLFGKFLFKNHLTLCACSGLNCVCRSYSPGAHRWHINHINRINSQVGQCCCIWRVVRTNKVNVILRTNWDVTDSVTDWFSLKIVFWQVAPFYCKTRWTEVVSDDQVRSPTRSWDQLKKMFNQNIEDKLILKYVELLNVQYARTPEVLLKNLNTYSSQR